MNKFINNCVSLYISIFLLPPPEEISLYRIAPNFKKKLSSLSLIWVAFIVLLFFFSFAIHNILILPSWLFLFYLSGKIFRIRREFKNYVSMWDNFLMIQEFIINNGLYKETSDIFLSAVFTILERENEIIITAYKMGNFLDSKVEGLDTELSGLLSLDITKKNIFADRVEYVFEKNKREIQQYVFANSDSKENLTREFFQSIPKDIIKLSNTQQFSLKRNTNIGLYGRTGSGKTVTLQWLLYNAISKGCGLYPDTYLSIVDGKGADLYSLGEILQETLGEQINIGQTPHSLAKLSREFCQIMNERFELIKNSETLNADAYDLKMTPNFLFVDELASIRDSCGSSKEGKALWNEILQNLGLIARKGRQAGCHLCISTQDPNAENIPVELRNQISAVLYMGSPSADRVRMAFAMCELENVPTVTGRKGEALYYADGENMVEPEITVAPFVDLETKHEFKQVILNILPNLK